jgi:Cupredoxin-like domain
MKPNRITPLLLAISLGLAIAGMSHASEPEKEIRIKIENHRFTPSRIEIPVNTKVKVTIENLDNSKEEFDSYDLNREVVVKGKSSSSFYIGPLSAGEYEFEGEYNPKTAQGKVVVK